MNGQKKVWIISFLIPFLLGLLLILAYCLFKDNYTLGSVTLSDWLNYFVASGTVGAFLSLIVDKISNERSENHKKWQSEIPMVTLTSPCDPTSNYCDINIVEFNNDYQQRGSQYFSVSNLGKTNAYDITIEFCSDEVFTTTKIFHRHYIPYLMPLSNAGYEGQFQDFIYSKFSVDPETKEISNKNFEICGCLNDCLISSTSPNEKYFYVRISYFSSLSKEHRHLITTILRINLICEKITIQEADSNTNSVKIKGITILDYEYS
ncbi:hypothetical protein OK18_00450 [Chryseobacterium gallinarum]|uniref:Uncharacterized protein n=1 Tax=Chryseobacterium gallinarum TaxID=1324352 RepID=A0A0G3LXF1_CHRGL|nr:hypothetical protein [Chryseobacterium gallinarum]AKK71309.1 hypothetical protein OK18_00450 [Chryseobacterium gallinarum]